jgi:hypothetical protein
MSRLDLTDAQIRALLRTVDRVADGRGHITTVEAGQIRRMAGELQELRAREAITRHLSGLEGAY